MQALPGDIGLVGKSIEKFQGFERVIREGAIATTVFSGVYGSVSTKYTVFPIR